MYNTLYIRQMDEGNKKKSVHLLHFSKCDYSIRIWDSLYASFFKYREKNCRIFIWNISQNLHLYKFSHFNRFFTLAHN